MSSQDVGKRWDAWLARKSAEDDLLVETLTKVGANKELGQFETAALLEVLNVDASKWAAHPIFNITQAKTDAERKLHASMLPAIQEDIQRALKWNGGAGSGFISEGYAMQLKGLWLQILWARGFATGQFTEGYWKTNADEPTLRKALDTPVPGVYRESFLRLYGPKSADPIHANDIAGASSKIEEGIEVDESSLLGAIVVGLVALGALLYLTRR